ncbi:electron transfer flavoprotein subunit alpha/FixB family protein [Rhizocola hellebori]|uniref:electron transfer flavoprotein subunit alpha/FixB family protein n=1 Tax=Rhizocola hellebori TaxID=1392758 RepID=UPI0019451E95|nr:electron transfer flavoprotein subunit alpha/FixB family protein [Rhizocola hellebori]
METVLVLADRHSADGGVCRSSDALLTVARRLGAPAAVLCGPADAESVAALGRYGAQAIYAIPSPACGDYTVFMGVEALVRLAAQLRPVAILIAAGHTGQEVAGRLAVRLDCGLITDAVDLWMGPQGPVAVHEALAGSYLVESRVIRGIPVHTVKTEAICAEPAPAEPVVSNVEIVLPARPPAARVVAQIPRSGPQADLSASAVVVAGGSGIGSQDSFELVEKVAQALGGCAGGSHTATALGWCPRSRQIDQVGQVVHPLLYLAMGVSGSVRHRAGMQSAKTVVAIDRDPHAPIFGLADFGIVGDLHQVVPELLAEIHRRKNSSEA